MCEKICSFCGHRVVADHALEKKVFSVIHNLVRNEEYTSFYSGGMGEFDKLCEKVVRIIKKEYPHIKLYRVLYKYGTKLKDVQSMVDEIIIPDLDDIYYKKAIVLRNQWMVEASDVVLCYIRKEYGGAYRTMRYAEKANVPIISI